MSAAPAVSVCIPVRNGADQLRHTLINLLIHSNYPADRWEVVLGDHDSADETAGIIAGFQERFPRVRSVRVPFTGANRASVRNRLIEESRGDLLVFIDHDVLASDDFLWKHVAAHERLPSSIVAGAIFGTFLERDLGRFGGQLELDHITASYDVLTSHPELADPRMGPASPADLADPVDVRDAPAPFRLFYGGNLSAYRSDIEACGRFDECYDGWGLEDDDFAQQFRVAGRGMAFSPGAWGFHMPGAGHDWNHLGFWRRNFETFFRKFTTREIEQYALYGGALLPLGMAHMESLLHRLRAIDTQGTAARVAGLLGPPRGRRLCHFVRDDTTAQALRLTDALQPFGPWTDTQREQSGTRWWPLVGIKTPFAGEEIDEVVVLVDVMMWLDHSLL
ncbi:MAG TPA: glycosyltransferase, partial [Gemmatimonadales bacterium]|nr:glycosyltransferase [Gemmatimonadales bacterium]